MSAPAPSFRPVFGRHQTFPLRLGWLPKAVNVAGENPDAFAADSAIVEFGVGKNMVESIRYWAQAAGVLEFAGRRAALTEFGRRIFGKGGKDPFLEDETTLWLLHWKLASKPMLFAANFWFFNRFLKSEFEEKEAGSALVEDMRAAGSALSDKVMRRDLEIVLRMHARRGKEFTEDYLESPFPAMRLIVYDPGEKTYHSEPDARPGLSPAVLGFAVAEMFAKTESADLPVYEPGGADDGRANPAAVFRLTRDDLLEKLNDAAKLIPDVFALRELAGAWRLFRGKHPANPMDFLSACFP